MCGICGKFSLNGTPIDEKLLREMGRAIAYRGPDDADVYMTSVPSRIGKEAVHVGLGHQRLSIIDLSENGRQPMSNEDGTIWITYNGEIYNFKALRNQLVEKGHIFKSDTDTEVILHLYEEEGVDAVKRLNGMFAFALWDARNELLWLCRDRIGIKPAVYYWDGDSFLFASEIKSLLHDESIDRQIDPVALQLYLSFSYVPAPYTIYDNIKKLQPGHYLTLEKGKLEVTRYWDTVHYVDPVISSLDFNTQAHIFKKKVYETLARAVKDRMIADVPLGAFLSGGIDSSIVVALMALQSTTPIKTFSIGFKGAALFDETEYSREVARHYQTEHHEFKLDFTDMLTILDDVLNMFDEPFSDSSALPTFVVSRETRKHVTVALSGDGGDELFAGYRSYLGESWARLYAKIPVLFRQSFLDRLVYQLPDSRDARVGEYARRLKKLVQSSKRSFDERVQALKEVVPTELRNRLLVDSWHGEQNAGNDLVLRHTRGFLGRYKGDRLNQILYSDFKDSLPGDMLTKVDWMSMRNSLEVRVPFLDHRVVDLAFRMPGKLKLYKGKTKYILKETFKDMLPASLYSRPKAGFEIPISMWLRKDLHFLIRDYLSKERIQRQGIFDYRVIDDLIKQHMSKRMDTSWILWNLIVFQYWYHKYL